MIKNTVNDPLQEEMLIKRFNESCKNVGYSEYGFGEAADMLYAAETAEAYNAFVESVGVAQLQYYNRFGMPLIITEETKEGEEGKADNSAADSGAAADAESKDDGGANKPSLKDKAKNAASQAGTAIRTRLNEILTTIQKAIRKIWNTIKEKLSEAFGLNKPFLEKYEPILTKNASKAATTKIYNFAPYNAAIQGLRNINGIKGAIIKIGNFNQDTKETLAKNVTGYATIEALSNAVVKEGQLTAGQAVKIMKGYNEKLKAANAAFAGIDNSIEGLKKSVAAGKLDAAGKDYSGAITFIANYARSISNKYAEHIKEENRAARAAAIKILQSLGKTGAQKTADNDDAKETEEAKKASEANSGAEKAEEAPKEESARLQNLSVNDMLEMFSFV